MSIQLKTALPGPKSVALMQRRRDSVAQGPFHTTPIFAARAHGSIIEDVDGNHLLDFASGIGVVNVGHTPAKVSEAIRVQADKFLHTSFNVVAYEGYVAVCEKLNQVMPGNFAKKSFLANSGAEAVENAIKIARTFTGKSAIACFEHGYHGRTYMAMSLTAKEKPYKFGFGPFPGPVLRLPLPYSYRWPGNHSENRDQAKVSDLCFEELKKQIQESGGPNEYAAMIIEPVLGEGGFIPVPAAFLKKLRQYCDENRMVLIFDEVQSGFGRTGTFFACEQLGVTPDLIVSAKGIAAGLPLSAVTGRAEIMDAPGQGGIGGTFSGNPIACAAALAVFEIFEDGRLLENAKLLGQMIQERAMAWKTRFAVIGDVRGLGPMLGMEFVTDQSSKEPNPTYVKKVIKAAYENGLILMNAGTYSNVIRFLPPISMTPEECREGLDVLEHIFQSVR